MGKVLWPWSREWCGRSHGKGIPDSQQASEKRYSQERRVAIGRGRAPGQSPLSPSRPPSRRAETSAGPDNTNQLSSLMSRLPRSLAATCARPWRRRALPWPVPSPYPLHFFSSSYCFPLPDVCEFGLFCVILNGSGGRERGVDATLKWSALNLIK